MKEELFYVGFKTPTELINIIECINSEFKGLCYYDEKNKILKSKDLNVNFYYDPYHGVLEIKYYER